MATPLTFFDKVWTDHVIADLGDDTALLQIDRLFLHELSGSAALRPRESTVTAPVGPAFSFRTPAVLRRMLLEGTDEIGLTLSRGAAIAAFRAADVERRPWAYGATGIDAPGRS